MFKPQTVECPSTYPWWHQAKPVPGCAAEIGRTGLAFAFDVLGVQAVVLCTVRNNVRSRAVMERIGMRYAGEIRSRGLVEGAAGERDDSPHAVCVLLRRDWDRSPVTPVVA